jgi:hypothetical protein
MLNSYDYSTSYKTHSKPKDRPSLKEPKRSLEDRYQKYVKKPQTLTYNRSQDSLQKVSRYSNENKFIISEYEIDEQMSSFRKGERQVVSKLSYSELRSLMMKWVMFIFEENFDNSRISDMLLIDA